jgi:hypothetical protein
MEYGGGVGQNPCVGVLPHTPYLTRAGNAIAWHLIYS